MIPDIWIEKNKIIRIHIVFLSYGGESFSLLLIYAYLSTFPISLTLILPSPASSKNSHTYKNSNDSRVTSHFLDVNIIL